MVQPTKRDEVELYRRCRVMSTVDFDGRSKPILPSQMETLFSELGIPFKRGLYILDKWEKKRWWQNASCPPGGWFEPEAPERIGVV